MGELHQGSLTEDSILEYVLDPDFSYQSEQLRPRGIKFPRFFVYGWRRENKYLYIGKTEAGWGKFKNGHQVINKVDKLVKEDFIDIWICKDFKEIDLLERDLINIFKPLYNKTYNPNYSRPKIKIKNQNIRLIKEISIPSEELMACTSLKELKELQRKYK